MSKHRTIYTWLTALLLASLPCAAWAAPATVKNGGDNGGTTYVDGTTAAGDTIVTYQDGAATPNTQNDTSNLTSVTLVLPIEKAIHDSSGKIIANASFLAKGQEIYYVLYMWNRTPDQTVGDVRFTDALPAGITFTGPIQVFNGSVAGNPNLSATWTTPASWMGLAWVTVTNAADGDVASIAGSTLSVGQATNGNIDVTANNVFAVRFKVRIN